MKKIKSPIKRFACAYCRRRCASEYGKKCHENSCPELIYWGRFLLKFAEIDESRLFYVNPEVCIHIRTGNWRILKIVKRVKTGK